MDDKKSSENKETTININASEETRKGVYSNLVNITTTTPQEVICNFILLESEEQGTLVSRVILSREHAEQLHKLLGKVLEEKGKD